MAGPTNAQIMHELGGLQQEMKHASESRGVLHAKLDKTADVLSEVDKRLHELSFALQVTTDVAVQARDHFNEFKQEFTTERLPQITTSAEFVVASEPILASMRIVRNIIMALLGAGILTAGGVIALAFYARDVLRAGIMWLLGV